MMMLGRTNFDDLPNELYYCIFEYLNPIDILHSFSNLNRRLNTFLKDYLKFSWKEFDLRNLKPNVFQYYLEKNFSSSSNSIEYLRLTGEQFEKISSKIDSKLRCLHLSLSNDFYFSSNELNLLQSLETFHVDSYAMIWSSNLSISCSKLHHVQVHLKSHLNLIELINVLPSVKKLHATIDYDVSKYFSLLFSLFSLIIH